MTFIKDAMKDVLISSTMSSLNDFFASKSLTTECILSSNKISYSLKSLIDIEAADYSFIDELIAQNVCDHLQIESLSLIKLKSIREFDDHYAKKLITHEFSHQHSKREESRRSRRDRRCSDNNVKRNVHLKKMSRLCEHVSMISVSAHAATYYDSDDDDDDIDTAMSFILTHELTCITTMLQRKKFILWVASYARYA